ncbi:MAG TPA: hypothetical protein VM925_11980 [Labilithrix sp.]|nr:hypothetical protein [Labilithrix sp.]
MNSLSLTSKSKDVRAAEPAKELLEEPWFDEAPPSTQRRASAPPTVQVGEFLGDPLADSWLR